MRISMAVLIIACAAAVSVQAQTVADLARLERARRANLIEKGPLITSEEAGLSQGFLSFGSDLSASAATSETVEGAAPEESSTEAQADSEASTEPVDDEGTTLDELTVLIEQQQELVSELEDQITVQQVEIVRLRDLFTAPVASGRERSQAQVELAAAESELEGMQVELEAARELLAELLAEVEAAVQE
jgi:hypothetical protein